MNVIIIPAAAMLFPLEPAVLDETEDQLFGVFAQPLGVAAFISQMVLSLADQVSCTGPLHLHRFHRHRRKQTKINLLSLLDVGLWELRLELG
jgi:hypothetical protein